MPEQNKPFVVTDRRKFTLDGDPRPDADPSPEKEKRAEVAPETTAAAESKPTNEPTPQAAPENDLPPAPTAEQNEQARLAYEMTADRLDTAIRSANPGMDHPPAMSFERLVQSVYMQAILQLGGGAEPGQQPQVDLLGARQSIDMLGILSAKTRGNLSESEDHLLQSALFESRMGFLEVTQLLARQAAAKQGAPPPPTGPSIVR